MRSTPLPTSRRPGSVTHNPFNLRHRGETSWSPVHCRPFGSGGGRATTFSIPRPFSLQWGVWTARDQILKRCWNLTVSPSTGRRFRAGSDVEHDFGLAPSEPAPTYAWHVSRDLTTRLLIMCQVTCFTPYSHYHPFFHNHYKCGCDVIKSVGVPYPSCQA